MALSSCVAGLDLDQGHARVADGVVVADAMGLLHKDFVPQAPGVGQTADEPRVLAGHAGRRGQRKGRGAAGRHQRRRTVQKLGNPLAHGHVQIVEPDELPGGNLHGRNSLGTHQGTGECRECAGRVDERADAQLVDDIAVRRSFRSACRRVAKQEPKPGNARQSERNVRRWVWSRLISASVGSGSRFAAPFTCLSLCLGLCHCRGRTWRLVASVSRVVRPPLEPRLPSQRGSPVAR